MSDTNTLIENLISGDEDAVLSALTSADPTVVSTIKAAATKVDKQNVDNQKQEAFDSLQPVFDTLRKEVEAAVKESFPTDENLRVELVVSLKDGVLDSMIKARKKGVKHPLVVGAKGVGSLTDFSDFGRNKRDATTTE